MEKILIIKLGAKGDVIRTFPVVSAIKKAHPNCELYWVTKKSNSELVKTLPFVKEVFVLPYQATQKFDLVYNFDIDDEATTLASKIPSTKKIGFHNEGGFVSAFNLGAEYYLNTLFDDETKKTNKLTYQEMMFMAAELPYNKEPLELSLTPCAKKYAEDFVKKNKINTKNLIGIAIGSSPRWPSKAWPVEKIEEFVKKVEGKYSVLLFAGPDDIDKQKKIKEDLEAQGVPILLNNPNNTDLEFASLVNLCKAVICPDSFALHISLALEKPTVCLFFCTSPDEVEGYGYLTKIVSPLIYDFFPQKQDQYSEELVNSISAEEVLKAVNSYIQHGKF